MKTTLNERLKQLSVLTFECPITIDWLSTMHHEGVRPSPYKGNGRDYCDFRDLRDGDKVTRINWKMLARRPERPVVTLFEEERNACVCVLVDVSRSMDMVSVRLSKRELACVLTASIIKSASRTNDTTMFATFDERGVKRYFSRRGSHQLTNLAPAAVLEENASYLQETGVEHETGLACALRRLPPTRSLVFVISDLHHLGEDDEKLLRLFGARHEIVFLSVSDLRERELPRNKLIPFLPIPGFYPLVDETGKRSVVCTTRRACAAHKQRFQDHENGVFERLAACRCKFASMHTEDSNDARRNQLTRILSGQRSRLNLNINLN